MAVSRSKNYLICFYQLKFIELHVLHKILLSYLNHQIHVFCYSDYESISVFVLFSCKYIRLSVE